jgi:ArsR family transcriptional regulator
MEILVHDLRRGKARECQREQTLSPEEGVDTRRDLAILPKMGEHRRLEGQTRTHMEARARVMKALAHPSRLFIVDELSRGERCVCELTEMVGADVSTVSKHLALLKQAGVVLDERRGQQVFYRLRVPCILNFFGCVEAVLEEAERCADAWRADQGAANGRAGGRG